MANQQPLISVLLIAMNHEKFIEQACKSIVNQSYKNTEVILSPEAARKIGAKDPRFFVKIKY